MFCSFSLLDNPQTYLCFRQEGGGNVICWCIVFIILTQMYVSPERSRPCQECLYFLSERLLPHLNLGPVSNKKFRAYQNFKCGLFYITTKFGIVINSWFSEYPQFYHHHGTNQCSLSTIIENTIIHQHLIYRPLVFKRGMKFGSPRYNKMTQEQQVSHTQNVCQFQFVFITILLLTCKLFYGCSKLYKSIYANEIIFIRNILSS